jgi:hypothetical protein
MEINENDTLMIAKMWEKEKKNQHQGCPSTLAMWGTKKKKNLYCMFEILRIFLRVFYIWLLFWNVHT